MAAIPSGMCETVLCVVYFAVGTIEEIQPGCSQGPRYEKGRVMQLAMRLASNRKLSVSTSDADPDIAVLLSDYDRIALTPDEKELWLADCANSAIHVFDSTVMPPKQMTSIKARDCVGWLSFSMDGRFAYSSTGEIIDVSAKKIVTALQDETGREVQSEKLLQITIDGGKVIRAGNQFGVGMKQK